MSVCGNQREYWRLLREVSVRITLVWDVTQWSSSKRCQRLGRTCWIALKLWYISHFYLEDGGSRFVRNIGAYLQNYTLSHSRRQPALFCDLNPAHYLTNYWPGQRCRYSDSLRVGRSGDRILVEARFSAPDQTGPKARSASYTEAKAAEAALIYADGRIWSE